MICHIQALSSVTHDVWLAQLSQHVYTLNLDHGQAGTHDHVIKRPVGTWGANNKLVQQRQ
jgi:hypothetical protein